MLGCLHTWLQLREAAAGGMHCPCSARRLHPLPPRSAPPGSSVTLARFGLPGVVGLTAGGDRLALYVHSPDTVKQLLLPPSFLRRFPSIEVRTDLVDMQVSVLHVLCW